MGTDKDLEEIFFVDKDLKEKIPKKEELHCYIFITFMQLLSSVPRLVICPLRFSEIQ